MKHLIVGILNWFLGKNSEPYPTNQKEKSSTTKRDTMQTVNKPVTIDILKRENFEPGDFFFSDTACERNINNTTDDPDIIYNLAVVASKIQEIRNVLCYPVIINSAYRCLDLNRAIGSKDTSQHIKGQAVDFICPDFGTPKQIVSLLMKRGIEVDQCILEGSWVHLSIKKRDNRNQFASLLGGEFKLLN